MLGSAGPQRELSFLPDPGVFPGVVPPLRHTARHVSRHATHHTERYARQSTLPVLIGSGTGAALAETISRLEKAYGPLFRLIVVDKEEDILAESRLREQYADYAGISWVTLADSGGCINELTRLQTAAGGLPFFTLLNPFYLRLDREFYNTVRQACAASGKVNFWDLARYAKFSEKLPRILLLTSSYFLIGEILAACKRLHIPHHLLQVPEKEFGRTEFIEALLAAVLQFKPDFVFTINHLGVDREGVLVDLLEKLRLPLASWFVDNPHLIIHLYSRLVSSFTSIFTWDADNVHSLARLGFSHVSYLPLGVDVTRFHPPGNARPRTALHLPQNWNGQISFVGNSMVNKILARQQTAGMPKILLDGYRQAASAFAASEERSVSAFLGRSRPDLLAAFEALPDIETKLAYEAMLTWEATRQYRLSCIHGILPYSPLIVGDTGWKTLFTASDSWQYRSELNYYTELPLFYPCSTINFNCTSKQMKGAVNQRVFDVPATDAFLLTDYREQVENLFEPDKEIICYHSPEEAGELARRYLARPKDRFAVARAARKRILQEHTYDHRVKTLVARMRSFYK
jgi:spore maturation protein CgeB